MIRLRQLSFLSGAAALTLLIPAPAAAGVAPVTASPGVSSFDGLDDAKEESSAWYIQGLEDLAEWCQDERAFQQRDAAYEGILVVDPEHKKARRYLKWTFDRSAGEWTRRRPYKLPSAGEPEIVAEARARRARLDVQYVDGMLEVLEEFQGRISPQRSTAEYDRLLQLAPDYAKLRTLLGYVKVEKDGETVWRTELAVATDQRRAELAEQLEKMRAKVPQSAGVDLIAPEPTLKVQFSSHIGNDRVRVVGDVSGDEAQQIADMGYLARDYLPVVLGGELPLYEDFTYYVINPRNKVSFIRSYPGIPADSLETYPQMFSGWMPGGTRVGCWGPDTEQRLDMALKQTTVMYMQVVHGVPWKRGWLIEGVGLYVNQLVLKTRHSFQVEITRYDDPTKPNTAREMPDQSDDWLEVAGEVLAEVRPTRLAATLGRNTSKMSAEDIILSYAMVKYLREAHGEEALIKIMKAAGAEEGGSSVVALEALFDMKLPQIQEQLRLWIEEVGGNDFD